MPSNRFVMGDILLIGGGVESLPKSIGYIIKYQHKNTNTKNKCFHFTHHKLLPVKQMHNRTSHIKVKGLVYTSDLMRICTFASHGADTQGHSGLLSSRKLSVYTTLCVNAAVLIWYPHIGKTKLKISHGSSKGHGCKSTGTYQLE